MHNLLIWHVWDPTKRDRGEDKVAVVVQVALISQICHNGLSDASPYKCLKCLVLVEISYCR